MLLERYLFILTTAWLLPEPCYLQEVSQQKGAREAISIPTRDKMKKQQINTIGLFKLQILKEEQKRKIRILRMISTG